MAAARKQNKRQKTAPRTPKKPKQLPKPIIGSSSTWKDEELERFKVRRGGEADPKTLIPEKWFDFESLERYQFGMNPHVTQLTIVRNQLTSIGPTDLLNDRVLFEKATHFHAMFLTLQDLENLKITETRMENLADKRHEKRNPSSSQSIPSSQVVPVWVGPPAPLLSAEETQRIASISDPAKSSAGAPLFHAAQERESEVLGNQFCITTLKVLYLDNPSLEWVVGRPELPVVKWRHRYSLHRCKDF